MLLGAPYIAGATQSLHVIARGPGPPFFAHVKRRGGKKQLSRSAKRAKVPACSSRSKFAFPAPARDARRAPPLPLSAVESPWFWDVLGLCTGRAASDFGRKVRGKRRVRGCPRPEAAQFVCPLMRCCTIPVAAFTLRWFSGCRDVDSGQLFLSNVVLLTRFFDETLPGLEV